MANADLTAQPAGGVVPACPSCGQHVDRTNLRCPRCRCWLGPPPHPPAWQRYTTAAAVVALVVVSLIGGMILQWLWAPLPWGVVVGDVGAH